MENGKEVEKEGFKGDAEEMGFPAGIWMEKVTFGPTSEGLQ